jgi:hypothetical protein
MDRIMPAINLRKSTAVSQVVRELNLIAPVCRWTKGRWDDIDGMAWDDIQNVPRHINLLSNVLIRAYLHASSDRQE